MNWYSGTLVLTFKDGFTDEMFDISFAQAQERVEACKDKLQEAMYFPHPVSMFF